MTSLLTPYLNYKSNLFDILQANLMDTNSSYSYDPPTDICEDTEKYTLLLEVPGLDKNDIEVTVDTGFLVIKAELPKKIENKKYLLKESFNKSFVKKFKLDSSKIDSDSIKSSLNNGVLTIEIKKSQKLFSKKIIVE